MLRSLAVLVAEAVGIDHGAGLVGRHVHQGVIVAVVRRGEAVQVAVEDQVAVLVIGGDAALRQRPFARREVLGLQFQAQPAGAGHVEAELQGRDVAALVVGYGRDVGAHNERRVDEVRGVLDVSAAVAVGVVAGPDLVEIAQGAVIHASAAR